MKKIRELNKIFTILGLLFWWLAFILMVITNIRQSREINKTKNEINDIKTEIEFRDYIANSNINRD